MMEGRPDFRAKRVKLPPDAFAVSDGKPDHVEMDLSRQASY